MIDCATLPAGRQAKLAALEREHETHIASIQTEHFNEISDLRLRMEKVETGKARADNVAQERTLEAERLRTQVGLPLCPGGVATRATDPLFPGPPQAKEQQQAMVKLHDQLEDARREYVEAAGEHKQRQSKAQSQTVRMCVDRHASDC